MKHQNPNTTRSNTGLLRDLAARMLSAAIGVSGAWIFVYTIMPNF